MVERKHALEIGYQEQIRRRLQVLYESHTREKQMFLEELKEYRTHKHREILDSIINLVGPKWYQVLSVTQRNALDTLEASIYKDLLEGLPNRSAVIMHNLGLVPCPQYPELMHCVSLGRDDPKEMLAELYFITYGYPINGKRTSYCLNARLILSAILYLGLDNLICMLEKTYAPDVSTLRPEPKRKPKPQVTPPSPYLQKMVAVLYEPRRARRKPPLPLPDLTELNQPYEEEPIMQKPPPPPPPPPPPKKRISISYCDQLAGINTIKAYISPMDIATVRKSIRPRVRSRSRTKCNLDGVTKKNKYGIGIIFNKKQTRRYQKPVSPKTATWNSQYTINGVFAVRGKTFYVLGNVSVLPAQGKLIHGGYAAVDGQIINVHCGYRNWPDDLKPAKCDCLKQWQDAVFLYAKHNKCKCGHYYDYGNDGYFSQEELPYFTKPSRHAPLKFHFDTIYDLDPQRQYIEKTFKKVWETDSSLRVDNDAVKLTDKKKKTKKAEKDSKEKDSKEKDSKEKVSKEKDSKEKDSKEKDSKEKDSKKDGDKVLQAGDEATKVTRKGTSQNCLGTRPKISEYLKCALRLMRKVNVAARLPDLHLVPELREWMRQRLYGKITYGEKKEYLRKSTTYWNIMFTALTEKGVGHLSPPHEPMYLHPTTWAHKQYLNDTFKPYTERYKMSLFKSHAYISNLLWSTMYHAELPDKHFREIYFSYMLSRVEDLHIIHPYCTRETMERKIVLMSKRYVCPPDGWWGKS